MGKIAKQEALLRKSPNGSQNSKGYGNENTLVKKYKLSRQTLRLAAITPWLSVEDFPEDTELHGADFYKSTSLTITDKEILEIADAEYRNEI